ncbi:MAG: hypothetical protein GWN18_20970, partial [Thermoplasmata archaeon]|nr:hypothetical protein [Thermoplasmata archaeon]NIS14623.1 hypothetical protein [Thermoplasmata archaeon]NIS22441.1 hypothetical protein [Thermoplasmata archaeon]NIT80370.1 hypothetical protein [Thermoplasmata archaeon]NIU51455.1 hypothetical protein [Thermoplasmata archaeon]
WSSLWDYAGINIFTDADEGTFASGGYFLSNRMTDEELGAIGGNNLFQSWQNVYDWWAPAGPQGQGPDDLENMTAVQVTGGHWQVMVERDTVVLADNIPSLLVIPNGKAGFYATPDFSNFWWQIDGDTAWKQEFIMQRTDTITSVMADFSTGVLRPFAPGNTTTVGLWAYDQNGDPISDISIDAWVQVYGASPYFDVTAGGVTDVTGRTSATIIGLSEDGGGGPLSNLAKQPLYMQAAPDYGWSVFTSVEIFNAPIQLYLSIEATPIIQPEEEAAAESEILITVMDENGDPQEGFDVSFTHEGGSLSAMTGKTDADGKLLVTYTMPEIAEGDDFTFGSVAS